MKGKEQKPQEDGLETAPGTGEGEVPGGGRLVLWVPLVSGLLVCLLSAGVLLAVPVGEELGFWAWGLVASGLAGLVGAFFSWQRLSGEGIGLMRERRGLELIRRELESEMGRLEARRQRFERRLLTYGEWMEFPDRDAAPVPEEPEQADAVREQDEAVARIVRERSEGILERFRGDGFLEDGKFSLPLLMEEVGTFVEEIARVYQPGAGDPLLETNVEKLLQAINRLSMQLLFQIEQLPLNLKDYSLARMAEHVRTASRFYGYYQTLQPYLPIANYTWQVGRVVAGANPLTAGTLVLGSEALRRGGRKVGKFYLGRYSLKLTQEAVRLLGNEVATVFDPGYRHRDSAWIYGVELAELVHSFAPSIRTLQAAFQQVGELSLRGSYNRVFLYRCLAAHASPEPGKFSATGHLSSTERHEIARRLEGFFGEHIHGRHSGRTRDWARGVEERLGVALRVMAGRGELAPAEKALGMVEGLAGFLVEVRGLEPAAVEPFLRETESWEHWRMTADRGGTPAREGREWPSLFDYPEIAEDERLLGIFFKDLLALEQGAETVDPAAFVAISEAARFLGAPEGEVEETLAGIYARSLGKRLGGDGAGECRLPGSLAVALAVLLPAGQGVDFLYPAEFAGRRRALRGTALEKSKLWLVGAGGMLWLLGEPERSKTAELPGARVAIGWAGQVDEVRVEMEDAMDEIVIRGGSWQVPVVAAQEESAPAPGIRVVAPGRGWGRGDAVEAAGYFRPLLSLAAEKSN